MSVKKVGPKEPDVTNQESGVRGKLWSPRPDVMQQLRDLQTAAKHLDSIEKGNVELAGGHTKHVNYDKNHTDYAKHAEHSNHHDNRPCK